ncbi:uncharacterized protein [Nicotiana tomentosiformis]|uniref:uncharacterized protein n=1 Tax=Nicotiana tomentosiformis TaxID=4098 RepID=UPI00388CDDD0
MAGISLSDPDSSPTWIVDLLVDATKVGNSGHVQMPTGDSTQITHVGNFHLTGGDLIKDVLCVPAFKFNLFSVSKLVKALQCFVSFYLEFFIFQGLFTGRVKGIGKKEVELYILRPKGNAGVKEQMKSLAVRERTNSELWHKRMGHDNFHFSLGVDTDVYVAKVLDSITDRQMPQKFELICGTCNKVPYTILENKSPFEVFHNRVPSFSHLRVIGYLCYATILPRQDKFSPRAISSVLLGYETFQKGYKLYDMEHRTVFISRDVLFHENIFPLHS